QVANPHHYVDKHRIVGLVPVETLRLTPAQVADRLADWRSLLAEGGEGEVVGAAPSVAPPPAVVEEPEVEDVVVAEPEVAEIEPEPPLVGEVVAQPEPAAMFVPEPEPPVASVAASETEPEAPVAAFV